MFGMQEVCWARSFFLLEKGKRLKGKVKSPKPPIPVLEEAGKPAYWKTKMGKVVPESRAKIAKRRGPYIIL
jgi:hypothetical protein